jgi:imidazolonepropionase-like amidohydrolase
MATAARIAHEGGCRVAIHACAPRTSSMAVAAGIDSIEHGLFLTADDITALGARGGAWVPTIDAMEAIRDLLGPQSSGGRLFAEGLDNVRELVAGARAAGVTVLAGTDLHLPHGEVAKEAHKLAEYGMPSTDVVDVLTSAAFRYVGRDPRFAAGNPADAVFVAGDPRDDLSLLERPALVLRHGQVISRPSG